MRYTPLDELLARPRVRILRALLHFDWVDVADLYDVCAASEAQSDRNSLISALGVLAKNGEAERRTQLMWNPRHAHRTGVGQCRITPLGRTTLAAEIAAAQPSEEDFADVPLAEPPAIAPFTGPKCARCPQPALENRKLCLGHSEHDRIRKKRIRPSTRVHLCSKCGESGHNAGVCQRIKQRIAADYEQRMGEVAA